jgi:hypothetical protein
MTWAPFPLAGGCYRDDTLPWSAQDTVNWIPVVAEVQGARTPVMLRGAPGLGPCAAMGDTFSAFNADGSRRAAVVIRGAYNADGVFVVVQGNTLYRYAGDFSTPIAIGTVPGVGRCSITHNQITGGSQIVIANGTAGYVYNTADGSFVQITDDGFVGAKSVDYIDSYIVGVEPGGRFWFNSALADATSYNTLDRYEAESAPDKIVGLVVSHSEVIVFGERTMEFFYDSGANTTTFQRRNGTQTEVGAASQFAIAKLDNTVYWLGNDGLIYRLDGYTPVRISRQPIEQQIARSDLSRCFAMVYEDRGHKIVYFTFPDGLTWGYDVATQEWHRRQSYRLKRWRVNTLTKWGTKWYAGDYTNGSLCTVEWGVNMENGAPLVAERMLPVVHADENRFRLNAVKLSIDAQKSVQPYTFAPSISGDVPDRKVGSFLTMAYDTTSATPATVAASSGFPPGLVLAGDGKITGQYTQQGTYSWTVTVTDANGQHSSLADSCVVSAPYSWAWVKGSSNASEIGRIMVPKSDPIAGVVWGGTDNGVYTTSDGKNWTQIIANGDGGVPIYQTRRIDVTDTAIVACFADGANVGRIYRKDRTAGALWTQLKNNGTALSGDFFVCSQKSILFIPRNASSALLSADDGNTWTAVSLPSPWIPGSAILNFDGIYIDEWEEWIIPGAGYLYIAEGVLPTRIDIAATGSDSWGTAAYSPALDVCVVAGTSLYTKSGKHGTWQKCTTSIVGYIYGVVWCDPLGVFVALNGSSNTTGLYVSADGFNWVAQPDSVRSTTGWLTYMPWINEMCSGSYTFDGSNATYVSTL